MKLYVIAFYIYVWSPKIFKYQWELLTVIFNKTQLHRAVHMHLNIVIREIEITSKNPFI